MDLRTARKRRKLTQQQLAAKSGVPQNTISHIESKQVAGKPVQPTASTADNLSRVLRFPIRKLFPTSLAPRESSHA